MENLMVFEGNNVEVFEFDGKVLFNPKDVAKILGFEDSTVRKAISKMSSNQVIKVTNSVVKDIHIRKLNNAGENFLTESGVYKLVMRSNKPEAEKFQDWVTDEVLPSIRKYGAYMTDDTIERALTDPDFLIQLATNLKEEKAKRVEAERKVSVLMHTNKLYTATEIAKELGMKSAIMLNKDLHDKRVQYQSNGTWVLYSDYANMGYVSIKQNVLDNGRVVYDRKWTQDGRTFLLDLYEVSVD